MGWKEYPNRESTLLNHIKVSGILKVKRLIRYSVAFPAGRGLILCIVFLKCIPYWLRTQRSRTSCSCQGIIFVTLIKWLQVVLERVADARFDQIPTEDPIRLVAAMIDCKNAEVGFVPQKAEFMTVEFFRAFQATFPQRRTDPTGCSFCILSISF